MSKHTFSPGEYKTRDGRKAVVLHVLANPGSTDPLIGYTVDFCGREQAESWQGNGRYSPATESRRDLMPPPPPRVERWGTVHVEDGGSVRLGGATESSEQAARDIWVWKGGGCSVIGLLHLTIEGEGPSACII